MKIFVLPYVLEQEITFLTESLRQTPSYQLTNKVLGLIVKTRSRTSPFFKVLTLIVITFAPAYFVKSVQVHIFLLLQHEQSSTPHYL